MNFDDRTIADYLILVEDQEGEASLINCNSNHFKEIKNDDGSRMVESAIVLQTCGAKNRNGRIYTEQTVKRMYSGDNVCTRLKMCSLFGEMGHPIPTGKPKADMTRMANIDKTRACHIIKDIDYSLNNANNLVMGIFKTTGSVLGQQVRSDIVNLGTQCSVSSRTLMSSKGVKKRGNDIIIDDPFAMYITHDLVDIPSDRNAHIFANDHIGISQGKVDLGPNRFSLKLEENEIGITEGDFGEILKSTKGSDQNQLSFFMESFDLINLMSPADITAATIELTTNGEATIAMQESSGITLVKTQQLTKAAKKRLNFSL